MPLVKHPTLTPQKLEANQANARQSRGPVTAEGIERLRAAHLLHGLYSKDVRGGFRHLAASRNRGTNPLCHLESAKALRRLRSVSPGPGVRKGRSRLAWLPWASRILKRDRNPGTNPLCRLESAKVSLLETISGDCSLRSAPGFTETSQSGRGHLALLKSKITI